MFNLIARRIDRIRVRATLRSHRPSAGTSGVLWIRRSKVRILPRQPATQRVGIRGSDHYIWWFRAGTARRALQKRAPDAAKFPLIRLPDAHLLRGPRRDRRAPGRGPRQLPRRAQRGATNPDLVDQRLRARPTGLERADAISIRIPIEGAQTLFFCSARAVQNRGADAYRGASEPRAKRDG